MKANVALVIGVSLLACAHAIAQPAASLGLPRPAAALGTPTPAIAQASFVSTARAAAPDPLIGDYIPAAQLGPISEVRYGPDITPDASSTPQERYNWGVRDPFDPSPAPAAPSRSQSRFGEKFSEMFESNGNGHDWTFQSDHCFDSFISPVSNPFLNEDPRSLTELRPIFMYQTIPSSNAVYHGGNVEWFGLQARLAITQRLSVVLSKLGGIWINPSSGSTLSGSSGFSEMWIGPKFTWYRDDQTNTISAFGLIFQLPTGSASTFQNTSGMSLTPYVNFAQKFGKSSYGTFNVMDTLGFAFATSSQRSNYVYDSLHVDFDVANANRIYPFIELNWLHYIRNGSAQPYGFEGQDLANIGAATNGHDFLGIAIGARYKFSEPLQVGIAASFPIETDHDLQAFRLTVDMIWRY